MVALGVVLALALAAQEKPLPVGTFSGTVLNSVTGAPLNKVELRAALASAAPDAPVASTVTDSKGHFTLIDLPAGEYRLQGIRNGYLDTYYGARNSKSNGILISLGAGETIGGLELKMLPFGVIGGTVRDPDGEPISCATILLFEERYEWGRRTIGTPNAFECKTDDSGAYRITDLEPGKYYVLAMTRSAEEDNPRRPKTVDHSAQSDQPRKVVLPTYYPGVYDPSLARLVAVGPGMRAAGIDIPLAESPAYRVTVKAAAAGLTVTDVFLSSDPDHSAFALGFWASRNQRGDFEFLAVPPGSYTVETTSHAGPHQAFYGRQGTLTIDHDTLAHITVQPGTLVTVHATVAGEAESKPERFAFTFVSNSGQVGEMEGSSNVFSLGAGQYQLYLEDAPSNLVIRSMRAGDTDIFADGLAISEGGGNLALEVVLAAEGGKVDGAVLDENEKPAAGATVLLIAEPKLRSRADSFHEFTADQYGRFHFENLRPGEYKLFAWQDVEEGAWFDPEFLANFEDQGVPANLPENGHVTVQLHLK